MNEQEVRHQISIGFEYSFSHDDWVTPLDEVLKGISAFQAHCRWTPNSQTIWEIVLHLAIWHRNIIERIECGDPIHPHESWPSQPDTPSEKAWAQAKEELKNSLLDVQTMILSTSLEKIMEAKYSLGDLLCRLTHNGYHIGQITKMRDAFGSNLG